jgi:hypothetical protein
LIIAEHLSSPFLDIRPSWTLDGAVVSLPSGDVSLEQLPFLWSAGIWQSDVFARNGDDAVAPRRVLLRVATHTLRRWKELGLNPFLEARAQIRDHLAQRNLTAVSMLTLL